MQPASLRKLHRPSYNAVLLQKARPLTCSLQVQGEQMRQNGLLAGIGWQAVGFQHGAIEFLV